MYPTLEDWEEQNIFGEPKNALSYNKTQLTGGILYFLPVDPINA